MRTPKELELTLLDFSADHLRKTADELENEAKRLVMLVARLRVAADAIEPLDGKENNR